MNKSEIPIIKTLRLNSINSYLVVKNFENPKFKRSACTETESGQGICGQQIRLSWVLIGWLITKEYTFQATHFWRRRLVSWRNDKTRKMSHPQNSFPTGKEQHQSIRPQTGDNFCGKLKTDPNQFWPKATMRSRQTVKSFCGPFSISNLFRRRKIRESKWPWVSWLKKGWSPKC